MAPHDFHIGKELKSAAPSSHSESRQDLNSIRPCQRSLQLALLYPTTSTMLGTLPDYWTRSSARNELSGESSWSSNSRYSSPESSGELQYSSPAIHTPLSMRAEKRAIWDAGGGGRRRRRRRENQIFHSRKQESELA
jgi:hypothetical protein